MRRRLAWAGAFALVAGGIATLVVAFPSPGPPKGAAISTVPGDVVKVDKPRPFAPREGQVLTVAKKFVATAVARRHVGDSWGIVAPSLRHGFTRKTWSEGDIPVVPFPVHLAQWRLSYSLGNEVDLQVALFPPPKRKIRPIVFDLTLQRFHRSGRDRWLVSSFVPAPATGGDFGLRSNRQFGFAVGTEEPAPASRTGQTWLLFPAGIFGLLLLVLAAVGIKSWRGARVYRAYVRERQT